LITNLHLVFRYTKQQINWGLGQDIVRNAHFGHICYEERTYGTQEGFFCFLPIADP